jgi:hypothetical protein
MPRPAPRRSRGAAREPLSPAEIEASLQRGNGAGEVALIEHEGAEAEEGEDKRVDVPRLLRDLHRLAETRERLGESPECPERNGKRVPHVGALDGGVTKSLLRQAFRDQRERGLAVPDALAALAPRHVHPAKIPVGDNFDGDVRLRLADGQDAKAGLERRPEMAGLREPDDVVVQRAAEAALVSDGLREGFGLVEEGPDPS